MVFRKKAPVQEESKDESSEEVEEVIIPTIPEPSPPLLAKRPRTIITTTPPKKKKGRPKVSPDKNIHLLFAKYTVSSPKEPYGPKVDKTVYHKELLFSKKPEFQTLSLPPEYTLKIGNVVAIWNYGQSPFVIRGITNNGGKSTLFKLRLSKVINIQEQCPPSPNPTASVSPKTDISVSCSDVWHMFTDSIGYVEVEGQSYYETARAKYLDGRKSKKEKVFVLGRLPNLEINFFFL